MGCDGTRNANRLGLIGAGREPACIALNGGIKEPQPGCVLHNRIVCHQMFRCRRSMRDESVAVRTRSG